MQATSSLDLSDETAKSLKQHKKGIDTLIRDLLNEEESQIEIRGLLTSYYTSKRGSVTHYQIQDDDEIDFDSKGNGSFVIVYDVDYHDGCRDRDSQDEDMDMIIKFNIDLNSGRLTLYGEDHPDRDPDEF